MGKMPFKKGRDRVRWKKNAKPSAWKLKINPIQCIWFPCVYPHFHNFPLTSAITYSCINNDQVLYKSPTAPQRRLAVAVLLARLVEEDVARLRVLVGGNPIEILHAAWLQFFHVVVVEEQPHVVALHN